MAGEPIPTRTSHLDPAPADVIRRTADEIRKAFTSGKPVWVTRVDVVDDDVIGPVVVLQLNGEAGTLSVDVTLWSPKPV